MKDKYFKNWIYEDIGFDTQLKQIKLDLSNLKIGLNSFDDFIVYLKDNAIKVYDRICDHNAGKLITYKSEIKCPLHGWILNPETGNYTNVNCSKKPIYENQHINSSSVNFKLPVINRKLKNFKSEFETKIRWLNHACLIIESQNFKIATDPWLIGPAFSNGWWLKHNSPLDSFEEINSCDMIFISHNHPDHLHPETLEKISKNVQIITPNFPTGSTVRYLKDIGFKNILELNLNQTLINQKNELSLTVVKSGDFRDDSGIILQIGIFTILLTVDSNYIDFWRFPKNLDLMASSFAGGASGFPLCFQNYSDREKKSIITRNKNAIKAMNSNVLEKAQPKYFLPYAGFFEENSPRDNGIKIKNIKNKISDYSELCLQKKVKLLDVEDRDIFIFRGNQLIKKEKKSNRKIDTKNIESYIIKTKNNYSDVSFEYIKNYFTSSNFYNDLRLKLTLTNDDFSFNINQFIVDFFSDRNTEFIVYQENLISSREVNLLHIKVRYSEFVKVIKQGLPWEDLSIGFQCRIYREPNVYNSNFWFHFTNIYVNDMVKNRTENCSGCEIINQSIY